MPVFPILVLMLSLMGERASLIKPSIAGFHCLVTVESNYRDVVPSSSVPIIGPNQAELVAGTNAPADTIGLSPDFEWPILPPPLCPQPYKIVILGSSTAVGSGALPLDSGWAQKFKRYVQLQNPQVSVTNLALGGYTTYHVNPTGFIPGPYKPYPDPARNITAALNLHPDAIIINLPSNDAAAAFTIQETKDNFERIIAAAASQHVPVWVTTSQPREGLSAGATNNLFLLRDWVNQRFGNKAIDFWTNIGNPDGSVNNLYDAGDGVHLNNLGHHLVFTRVLFEKIWDSICIGRNEGNLIPIAHAGADTTIYAPADSAFLDGSESYDLDGSIVSYKWRKVEGQAASIANEQASSTWVRNLMPGNYLFELTVTDDKNASAADSVRVQVRPDALFTWAGTVSTDWEDAANWIGSLVPSSASMVIIPAGRPHYPIIKTSVKVKSLFCATGAVITVAANGSVLIIQNEEQ